MQFENKVAFVTGGAHGIGRALCRLLASRGAKVAVADLDGVAAGRVAEETGGLALETDVANEAQFVASLGRAEASLGPVDIMVSNAGVAYGDGPGGPASAANERWRACLDINLMAHVYAARAVIPGMVQRGGGCLVNVVSAAGLLCQIGEAAYTASKHAAVGFAESLAIAHGEDGVHVCLVCPQAVATRMIGIDEDQGLQDGDSGFGGNDIDGILSPEYVAECIAEGILERRFLVLPHPQVNTYFRRKADDHDRWVEGMRRYRMKLTGEQSERN